MSLLTRAIAAVWEFVVGDDWLIALGVAAAIGVTAALAALELPAWWLMPVGAAGLLWLSLRRAK
ncbi:MAG: hypothetical protein JOZ07_16960 [Solirubrobacterales bacterium]|nr:hypothetical protein [Solirubrobacterales bacterium]